MAMLSFIQLFQKPTSYGDITEELNPAQKKVVNTWKGAGERARQISTPVIPPDQDKITVPFDAPQEPAEPHPDVQDHLEKHGYKVKDYRAGLATDKYGRDVKIGGVLNKTKASTDLLNTFVNDPNRAASKAGRSGLSITYSRHPHDVAGMSTNQGWASCMSMGSKGQIGRGDPDYDDYDNKDHYSDNGGAGSYSHYLKPDTMEGTHVAYLHHAGDTEASRPLARIALKPHEPNDSTKSTILRPENRMYGTADDAFGDAVKKWSEKNFPADKDTVYTKNQNLYNDDNRQYIGSPETLYNSPNIEHRRAAFDPGNDVSSEMIHKGIKDKDIYTAQAAMRHPNATQEHVQKGIDSLNLQSSIAERKDLTPEQISKLARSNDPDTLVKLARNNQLKPDDISRLLKSKKSQSLKMAIFKHQNVTPEHLDSAVNDNDFMVRGAAATNPNATDEHLSKAMQDSPYVAGEALKNPNIKPKHIMDYFDRKDRNNSNNDYWVFKHPMFNASHLQRAIQPDQPEGTRNKAIEHELMTPEILKSTSADENQPKKIRDKAARYLKSGQKTGRFPAAEEDSLKMTPAQTRDLVAAGRGAPGGTITPETMQRINRQDEIRRMENAEFGRRRR